MSIRFWTFHCALNLNDDSRLAQVCRVLTAPPELLAASMGRFSNLLFLSLRPTITFEALSAVCQGVRHA